MNKAPLSVILPVYNGERYIAKAIDSVLEQSYENFELIIINDGSTDTTAAVLDQYSDRRIRVITQENHGLVASLNRAIKVAEGAYIARHDADDWSDPYRLEKQISYLESHPNAVIVGSSIKVMDQSDRVLHEHRVLLNDAELRQELLVRSPFAHGSVIFKRKAALEAGLYEKAYWPAEDYEFWLRLSAYGDLANIDEPLYFYREHPEGISSTQQAEQQAKVNEIQRLAWQSAPELIKTIRTASYASLPHGNIRIQRIMSNVSLSYNRALKEKNYLVAGRLLKSIAINPIVYRKVASKIKRRIKK